jgi:cytochrome P450
MTLVCFFGERRPIPEELAKLRARPTLINSAVEECLRFDGPVRTGEVL